MTIQNTIKKVKLESSAQRSAADIKVRECRAREMLAWLFELLSVACGASWKLKRSELPEVHLRREREKARFTFSTDYRGADSRAQLFASERADDATLMRGIATELFAMNQGLQESKNRAGEVTRVGYLKRGYKELLSQAGFAGKCSSIEFGAHSEAVNKFIAQLSKIRGANVTSAEKPLDDNGKPKQQFVSVVLDGAPWRTHPDNAMKLDARIKRGEVSGIKLEIPEAVATAWREAQKAKRDKAQQRDALKAKREANGKPRASRKPRSVTPEAIVNATSVVAPDSSSVAQQ